MSEFSVWLPFPPSVNNLNAHAAMRSKRTGGMVVRRFPTKAYKRWRHVAGVLLMAAKPPRYADPVIVKLQLIPRDKRRRDADNYAKAILDLLVASRVLADDSNEYVRSVIPLWEDANKTSGVRVTLSLARMN